MTEWITSQHSCLYHHQQIKNAITTTIHSYTAEIKKQILKNYDHLEEAHDLMLVAGVLFAYTGAPQERPSPGSRRLGHDSQPFHTISKLVDDSLLTFGDDTWFTIAAFSKEEDNTCFRLQDVAHLEKSVTEVNSTG